MKTKQKHAHQQQHKKENKLSKDNSSVSRFVNEGNPDGLIKETQEEWGEDSEQPIPNGDQP